MSDKIACADCGAWFIPDEAGEGRCDFCGTPYATCPSCNEIEWGDHCGSCGDPLPGCPNDDVGGDNGKGDGGDRDDRETAFPNGIGGTSETSQGQSGSNSRPPPQPDSDSDSDSSGSTGWSPGIWLGWLTAILVALGLVGWFVTRPFPEEGNRAGGPDPAPREAVRDGPSGGGQTDAADRTAVDRVAGRSSSTNPRNEEAGGGDGASPMSESTGDVSTSERGDGGDGGGEPAADPVRGFTQSTRARLAPFEPAGLVGTWTGDLPRSSGSAREVYLQLSRRADGRLEGLLSLLGSACNGRLEQAEAHERAVVFSQEFVCPDGCRAAPRLWVGRLEDDPGIVVREMPDDGAAPAPADLRPAQAELPPLPPATGDCRDP